MNFRLLTEYYSFLYIKAELANSIRQALEFPSPYGVLFILILKPSETFNARRLASLFPSPYGVLFILISLLY